MKIPYLVRPKKNFSYPISSIEKLFSVELYNHFLLHTSIFLKTLKTNDHG